MRVKQAMPSIPHQSFPFVVESKLQSYKKTFERLLLKEETASFQCAAHCAILNIVDIFQSANCLRSCRLQMRIQNWLKYIDPIEQSKCWSRQLRELTFFLKIKKARTDFDSIPKSRIDNASAWAFITWVALCTREKERDIKAWQTVKDRFFSSLSQTAAPSWWMCATLWPDCQGMNK